MKRDPQLHGLSSDHHHALVLARDLSQQSGGWNAERAAALRSRFERELEPHFRIEEQLLLPALREAGCAELVQRTLEDHAELRALVAQHDEASARRFGALLHAHVRFEEAELFPACETRLPAGVLEEVARRAPKKT